MQSSESSTLRKNGKDCLLCVSRKKLIIVTPEEKVRQKFVTELVEKYGYPIEMIEVEVPLSYYDKTLKGRVDIVISGKNKENNQLHPLLIVECKQPNVALTDVVFLQAQEYDSLLRPKVTVVTNSVETIPFQWDEKESEYVEIERIPAYTDLVSLDYFNHKEEPTSKWTRPNHLLPDRETFQELVDCGTFGEDTPTELHSFFTNLVGLFTDENEEISSLNISTGTFNKDCFVRFTTFGNVTGGSFSGEYRSVLITENGGDSQIVSMTLMSKMKTTNHPKYGNSKGHTLLLVAVDDYEKSHLSLQLALDRYVKDEKGIYYVWHDGTLTIGKKGRAKRQSVIDFVQAHKPSLIKDNKIVLGHLDNSKPFTWQNPAVNNFISNLADYALIRDLFRRTQ